MGEHQINPSTNPIAKFLRLLIPVTENYEGGHFFVRRPQSNPSLYATPLLVVLLVIETTDVLFAVDSVPAILAITLNAFVVYTSNVFAIIGLRSMYFAIAGLMKIFRFLHYGLGVILALVGLKMIVADHYPIPIPTTLLVVAGVLLISIAASVLIAEKPTKATESPK